MLHNFKQIIEYIYGQDFVKKNLKTLIFGQFLALFSKCWENQISPGKSGSRFELLWIPNFMQKIWSFVRLDYEKNASVGPTKYILRDLQVLIFT